jgi:hypothetical protein
MAGRDFEIIRVGQRAFEFEVMIHGGALSDRQPLLILHSIEFAVPPSEAFCDAMWKNGLQVIFVRRAGFGRTSPLPQVLLSKKSIVNGATAAAEAAMLQQLIEMLRLENVVLLANGSSNPVAYRLVQFSPQIQFSLFINPIFNQEIWNVFTPVWFRKMLKQIVTSKSGLQVAFRGLKLLIQRDPIAFYRHIFAKNNANLDYVQCHADDYREAGDICLSVDANQLFYDTIMCLGHDPMLKDGFFANVHGAILIGRESGDLWRRQMIREAQRVQLPLLFAPQGDLLCAYASPELVLDTIAPSSERRHRTNQKTSLAETAIQSAKNHITQG